MPPGSPHVGCGLLHWCCLSPPGSPTSSPVTATAANGAASVAHRPQGRELALQKEELGYFGGEAEETMLLLPSQTVDPATTTTPYSDATQVRASY